MIADYIKEKTGQELIPNPLEGVEGAGRQGDALLFGVKHELKSLKAGATPNTIKNVVNNSIKDGGQARNIIIDARGSGLTEEAAQKGASKALGISRGLIDNITIIGDNYFFNRTPT